MWTNVKSSNIAALTHVDATLMVRFRNGTEYHYDNVPSHVFDEIIGGASVGGTFHKLIKSKPEMYPCHRAA
jgi:hypothetical protein